MLTIGNEGLHEAPRAILSILLPVFCRGYSIIFLKNTPEISGIRIAQFLCDGSHGHIRSGEKPRGLLHFEMLDIFAEADSRAGLDDPLNLAFAVVEEVRKLF